MKIKCDFITNSSSTSFVVLGIKIEDMDSFLSSLGCKDDIKNFLGYDFEDEESFRDVGVWNFEEYLRNKNINLEIHVGSPYSDDYYIGVDLIQKFYNDWNVTVRDLVGELITEFGKLGIEVNQDDIGIHEECYYDG